MGLGERRRRRLTPLSGELRAQSSWEPSDPTRKTRSREEKRPPSGRGRVILAGLRRSALVLILLAALICGAAVLMVKSGDMPPERAFPLAFYIGGAIIAGGGFFGATTGPVADWAPEGGFEYGDHAAALNRAFVYGVFGVLVILVGGLIDWQT